jgi:hypothetical protein
MIQKCRLATAVYISKSINCFIDRSFLVGMFITYILLLVDVSIVRERAQATHCRNIPSRGESRPASGTSGRSRTDSTAMRLQVDLFEWGKSYAVARCADTGNRVILTGM